MLISLSEGLSADERLLYALLRPDIVAYCPQSGARLLQSLGRSRSGSSHRYWLVVPDTPPLEPLQHPMVDAVPAGWRAIVRAPSVAHAIDIGNRKLATGPRSGRPATARPKSSPGNIEQDKP